MLKRIELKRSYSDSTSSDNSFEQYSALATDQGYSYRKSKIHLGKKFIPYTEDAHARFSFDNYDFLVIADGHNGYQLSRLAVALAEIHLKSFIRLNEENIPLGLQKLFEFIHKETKLLKGGTTFNLAIIDKQYNELYVANLGDSPLMVLRKNKLLFKTVDHDANNIDERARIFKIDPNHIFIFDNPSWRLKTNLMTSRGFGDKNSDIPIGVISRVPDITVLNLLPNDLIIQCSDGLMESFHSEVSMLAGMDELRVPEIIEFINQLNLNDENVIKNLPKALLEDQIKTINKVTNISYDSIKSSIDNQVVHVYLVKEKLIRRNSF
jgi:serine/threonine protein phosphatase PrpC